ncbi:hypothetical protein DQ353_07355 [Arthrobacter sp. AQ5-05]|nr:hypothetical protein DQ353_07355 [Arthrobacter sp. AQ5-05]
MASRSRRDIRTIDVIVNDTTGGTMPVESERHSPPEHLTFNDADAWLANGPSFEISPDMRPGSGHPESPVPRQDLRALDRVSPADDPRP